MTIGTHVSCENPPCYEYAQAQHAQQQHAFPDHTRELPYVRTTGGLNRILSILQLLRILSLMITAGTNVVESGTAVADEFDQIRFNLFPLHVTTNHIKIVFRKIRDVLEPGIHNRNIILPACSRLSDSVRGRLRSRLLAFSPQALDDDMSVFGLVEKDIILLRIMDRDHPHPTMRAAASMKANVLTLYPSFFKPVLVDMISDFVPTIGRRTSDLLSIRNFIILHELTHSRSILGTFDAVIYLTELLLPKGADILQADDLSGCGQHPGHGFYMRGYSARLCQFLSLDDDLTGGHRAWFNAQNWALLGAKMLATLVYPDLDFKGRFIRERKVLLHHNSMFVNLQHPSTLPITELPGYDESQDLFRTHLPGRKPPSTAQELEGVIRTLQRLRP